MTEHWVAISTPCFALSVNSSLEMEAVGDSVVGKAMPVRKRRIDVGTTERLLMKQ
jgi:hypothetical protein